MSIESKYKRNQLPLNESAKALLKGLNKVLKSTQDHLKITVSDANVIIGDEEEKHDIRLIPNDIFNDKRALKENLEYLVKVGYLNMNNNEYSITEKGLEYLAND